VMLAFFFFLGLITMFGIELNAVLFESSARPVPSRPSRRGADPCPGGAPARAAEL